MKTDRKRSFGFRIGVPAERSDELKTRQKKSTGSETGVPSEKSDRMKTYRSEECGFEIDVPEDWSLPRGDATKSPFGVSIVFYCGAKESFNIQIGSLTPEPLDQTESEFRRYAQSRQYTELELGRISVGDRDHVWARYRMGSRAWAKKYLIVFGETEYAITAVCFDQRTLAEREEGRDAIVRSFRLLTPIGKASKTKQEDLGKEASAREVGEQARRGGIPLQNSKDSSGVEKSSSEEVKTDSTLTFSMISYFLIASFASLHIHFKVGFGALLFLTNEVRPSLSDSQYNVVGLVLFFGTGALICLAFLLGVAVNRQGLLNAPTIFNLTERTMLVHEKRKETLGGLAFSDFTRRSSGIIDALRLQVTTLIHALVKILSIAFALSKNRPMGIVIVLLFIVPKSVLGHSVPMIWTAGLFFLWLLIGYRAELVWLAKMKGVARAGNIMNAYQVVASSSLDSSIQLAATNGVTLEFIAEVLSQENVIRAIRGDMLKTGQIGYKEEWRLGLITPDQDRFDPSLYQLSRQERIKRFMEDLNSRLNLLEQMPIKRKAVLHSRTFFDFKFNNILIVHGTVKPWIPGYPGWSHRLSAKAKPGSFRRIREIRIATNSVSSKNRSPLLPQFLQEDGFPLKESYADGDPLTTERGGTIVIDKGRIVIIYPGHYVQRRLIDDEGNLVYLGLDESFDDSAESAIKMRPSVSESLIRFVSYYGYMPILRYRSFPYASDIMLPILDTPMSCNGWADLFIDTRGKARLFIAKENTEAEWREMLDRLRQLFYGELARKGYHLLGLTKDKVHLNEYLAKKQGILADYFIIQDWVLP